jgi:hypothetical protein
MSQSQSSNPGSLTCRNEEQVIEIRPASPPNLCEMAKEMLQLLDMQRKAMQQGSFDGLTDSARSGYQDRQERIRGLRTELNKLPSRPF